MREREREREKERRKKSYSVWQQFICLYTSILHTYEFTCTYEKPLYSLFFNTNIHR